MRKTYECKDCSKQVRIDLETEEEFKNIRICPFCGSDKFEQKEIVKRDTQYKELFDQNKTIAEVAKEMGVSEMTASNHYFELHLEDPERYPVDSFIQEEYVEQILKIAKDSMFDGFLKTIKNQLPQGATYNGIKAVLAKNYLLKH